jgi:hypothetical protein
VGAQIDSSISVYYIACLDQGPSFYSLHDPNGWFLSQSRSLRSAIYVSDPFIEADFESLSKEIEKPKPISFNCGGYKQSVERLSQSTDWKQFRQEALISLS